MKKLLLITQHFPPINIVGALRPYRMAKHLCRHDWQVRVIAYSPTTENAGDYQLLEELPDKAQIYFLPHVTPFTAKEIMRQKNFFVGPNRSSGIVRQHPIVKRLFGNARDSASKILFPDVDVVKIPTLKSIVNKVLNDFRPDVILTTSPPQSMHLVGLMVNKKSSLKWIADFRDPWDYYPLKGHYDLENRLERHWKNRVMQKADCITSSSVMYSSILKESYRNIPAHKFVTVTNSFDKNKIPLTSVKDPSKFVISYTGIFYSEKDPFTFFRAMSAWFKELSRKDYDHYSNILRIQLIGSSNSMVRKVIQDLKLENIVKFIGRLPHIEAVKHSVNSDMLLIATGLGKKTRPGWTPSKLYEYLGCRVPILAITREGELADIIRRTKSGYVIIDEDHRKIRDIVEGEIRKKFSTENQSDDVFTFQEIDKYEETRVMEKFVDFVENIRGKYLDLKHTVN